MGLDVKSYEFNETLSMVSTINKNPKNGSFVEKNVSLASFKIDILNKVHHLSEIILKFQDLN